MAVEMYRLLERFAGVRRVVLRRQEMDSHNGEVASMFSSLSLDGLVE